MNTSLIIYHDKCDDGFGAAYLMDKIIHERESEEETFLLPCSYGDGTTYTPGEGFRFKGTELVPVGGMDVYILDYSFDRDTIYAVMKDCKNFYWLDHHKSAIQNFMGTGVDKVEVESPNGTKVIKLDVNYSGVGLVAKEFGKSDISWVQYIQDNDLWKFQYPATRSFIAGLRTIPKSTASWDKAFENSQSIANLVDIGEGILAEHERIMKDLEKSAIQISIGGEVGLAVNSPYHFASEIASRLSEKSGTYGVSWYLNEKQEVRCSFRSHGYDTTQLTKKYGGGGHNNASGCSVDLGVFSNWLRV